ncbi:MAG: sugar phosphate isomerase/epimerase [Clostridia bacterium]|nr:sugar phosphate isomerase/epimerase [Clostridia bacterium]NLS84584.1 sugar phosphate isomerase/epimerase [Oscillospiraceae bacterium]
MKMSLLTNSLTEVGVTDLHTIADWAAENDIHELDVGPAIAMDQKVFEDVLAEGKVEINTMIYCRNFLSENEEEAKQHQKALKERIAFAGATGIEKIVCSTGVTKDAFAGMGFQPEKSLDACVELAKEFIEEAEKYNVKLCWENCPMMGNIATSPDMWQALFERLDSDKIGLCYDPSHLVWQMIDPYDNIFKFKEKIFHFHAKDTYVDRKKLNLHGALQNSKWWIHRLPGLGSLDWNRIVDDLYQIGYNKTICIEHEDPVWGGTEEKVKRGILKTRDHVSQFFMD